VIVLHYYEGRSIDENRRAPRLPARHGRVIAVARLESVEEGDRAVSDEREDLEDRLRRELGELAHSAPARDDSRPATRDPRRGRALLAAAAIVVVIAVIAALTATRDNASAPARPPITRVQLVLAPITSRTKPPCRATKVLDPASQKCLTLAAPVARNADVVAATVAYITQDRAWAVVMTLDAPALARIARLANPNVLELPTTPGFPQGIRPSGGSVGFVIPEVAVVVDGQVVDIETALVGGNIMQIVRPRQTRAAAIALATGITGQAPAPPSAAGLTVADHWHVALGVDDCGTWVPNWKWPPGNTAQGAPARAGSNGRKYAGLHSHDDGLIHMEAASSDETGAHATPRPVLPLRWLAPQHQRAHVRRCRREERQPVQRQARRAALVGERHGATR